jgi:hypothetical protein
MRPNCTGERPSPRSEVAIKADIGGLHCVSDCKGGQTIKDAGPLTKTRMETIDEQIGTMLDKLHEPGIANYTIAAKRA